jgi:hypothetical protein
VVPPERLMLEYKLFLMCPKPSSAAYQRGAWARVGYRTWDEYCETELGGVHLWLPREERPQVVDSLREAGRFNRTIASVTGQSLTNVHGVAIP